MYLGLSESSEGLFYVCGRLEVRGKSFFHFLGCKILSIGSCRKSKCFATLFFCSIISSRIDKVLSSRFSSKKYCGRAKCECGVGPMKGPLNQVSG